MVNGSFSYDTAHLKWKIDLQKQHLNDISVEIMCTGNKCT